MKRFLSIFIFIGFIVLSYAQQKKPFISFENIIHDFGIIDENEGIVTYKFWYKNVGGSPLIINLVNVSCGCTTPKYTKEPVLPNERKYIEIGYNPKDRPGTFHHRITVISNAINKNVVLEIKGVVEGRVNEDLEQSKSIEEKYKFQLGEIRADANHITFSKIIPDTIVTKVVKIYNTGVAPVTVSCKNLPKHISARVLPEVLNPHDSGKIIITYNSGEKNDWGFVFDRVSVAVNNDIKRGGMITVSANIIENFNNLTSEQKANAPVISFVNKTYNFDTIYENSKIEFKYEFGNKGKSDLIIRKVKPSCGCTASHIGENIIKPGQESFITATFNAGNRKGYQSKTITVITNDPANSTIILRFDGYIIPPKSNE